MEATTKNQFDPEKFKQTTFVQWQAAAEAWYRWSPAINRWLGKATDEMFDIAGVGPGQRLLDVAAGAGEQSIAAARRVGPTGSVLATDISPNILKFAEEMASHAKLDNIQTQVMDGENLMADDKSFDVVYSRVGLIYFPNQQRALQEAYRVLKPGGRIAAVVYSTPDKNEFFSIPISIIRQRAKLPPPLLGQPGPFSLGNDGAVEKAFSTAGFKNTKTVRVNSPVIMSSAQECVQFERESFGALHQMMSNLSDDEKLKVWQEIQTALIKFEVNGSFIGPCEMIVAVGVKF